MPGRLDELSTELTALLEEIREEAARREIRELQAPLDWLDEANAWLSYELARLSGALPPEAVPFTYIPIELRR